MPCGCVGVEFGTYGNQIKVDIPLHMAEYAAARLSGGLSGTIGIDACILDEIQSLWSEGIVTYGSCCGHNKSNPMVNVSPESISVMKRLEYCVQYNPNRPKEEDTFTLKGLFS